jgi:hypothetical protein
MNVGTNAPGDEPVADPAEDVFVASRPAAGDPVAVEDEVEVEVAVEHEVEVEDRFVPNPPVTGDAIVDEAMAELAEAQPGSNAERIDAGERAHRTLQGRLADLGGA